MDKCKLIIIGCLLVILILVQYESHFSLKGKTVVRILDVGQGDSIFITSPSGRNIIIDGGPNMDLLQHIPRYTSFFNKRIDLLIVSHPDSDHITALPEVLRRYDVTNIMLAGTNHSSSRYLALLEELKTSTTNVLLADPQKDLSFGDGLILDVIHPSMNYTNQDTTGNNQSIVLRLQTQNSSMLLTGDIEKHAEIAVLQSGENIEADYIKVPHHGSRTSSSTGFIIAINPTVALISAAGIHHSLNHPHQDVVDRYHALNIKTRGTHIEGTIEITL